VSKIKDDLLSFFLLGKIIDQKKGTFGIVYIVEQEGLPKYVAYKTVNEKIMKEIEKTQLEKFIHEIRQWFKVRGHPLVLTPHYITIYKGIPLICMPFCEMDLRTYLEKREKLDFVESLVIVAQILNGLIFAQRNGIEAHQDLKPENVLLEDLSGKFFDFPPKDLPCFRYKVRIADFGNANAWKELSQPYGSRPYMAPEQYKEEKVFSKVDVFAVGVILHELLTGFHPIGQRTSDIWPEPKNGFPKKYKHEKPWKKWASNENKQIKIGESRVEKDIENLIKRMLLPGPLERISLSDALNEVMRILFSVNEAVARQLKLLLDYYNCLANYFDECKGRLSNLVELSRVSGQLDAIVNEIMKEVAEIEVAINDPAKAVYFCELCHTASVLLIRRNKGKDKEIAEKLAEKIIYKALEWEKEISVCHKYPPLKFRGKELISTPTFRDFEVFSELIGYGKRILEKIKGRNYIAKYFDTFKSNTLKVAYLFNIASDFHGEGNNMEALKVLDKCIELNPNEASFYYKKALWAFHYLMEMEALGKLENAEKQKLIKMIQKNATKAVKLAPDWDEPKRLLNPKNFRFFLAPEN
jgi:serine/threonine protein kinase